MSHAVHVKATHKAIQTYYQTLIEYREHDVGHETALRSAFQNLLAETAKTRHWLLVPEQSNRAGGKRVVPDGTLCDDLNLRRGYWEAKDTDDDLDAEIGKKIDKGYPLSNIIFEDTRQAVLFQGKREVLRVDLSRPAKLADLLNQFYAYTEPEIEDFAKAVEEFKDRVPDLAQGLADKIEAAHHKKPEFQTAFDCFFALCQTSLNPNISQAAVDEMLVQHLLTERLFRKIFDNPDFTRRNVIAAEIEKVIDALVSKSFNRDDFLKSLDRFYMAIENAARTIADFSEKQHFLNTRLRALLPGLLGQGGRHARHRLHAAGHRRLHVRQRRRGAEKASSARTSAIAGRHTSSTPAPAPATSSSTCCAASPSATCRASTASSSSPTRSCCCRTTSPR